MTQKLTCDSVVTFLRKEAVLNARLGDFIPRPINAEGDLSTKTIKMAQKVRQKLEKPQDSIQPYRTTGPC